LTSSGGRVTSYVGPAGTGLTFVYNKQDLLTGVTLTSASTPINVTVTVVGGRITEVASATRHVSYLYSAGPASLGQVLTGFVDANGNTTTYAYNPNSSLLTSVTPAGDAFAALSVAYGAGGVVQTATSVANPQDLFADRYAYTGSAGDLTTTRTSDLDVGSPPAPTEVNYVDQYRGYALQWEQAPLGGVSAYNYSSNYGVTAYQDALGGVQTMAYDPAGDLVSQADPAGGTVFYTYDPLHDVLSATDADGNTTGYLYQSPHVVSWEIQPAPGGPKGVPGPQGLDGTHNLYNRLSELVEKQTPTGIETFSYDNAGNQSGYQYYNVTNPGLTAPLNAYGPLTLYDEAGDKVAVVQSRGHGAAGAINPAYETTYTYDGDGNLVSTANPGQGMSSATYNPDGSVATVQNAGQATATTYAWDPSTLTQTTTAGPVTTTSTYDASGDLLATSDAGSHTTGYTYDGDGRQLTETTPDNVTTTYTYDADGDVLTSSDTDGNTGTFTYDADHRLTGSVTAGTTMAQQYDPAGNVTSITTSGATTSYSFNDRGLMASVTNSAGTTSYGYDLSGNLTSVTDGDGNTTRYTYNGASERTSTVVAGHTWTYAYDADLNQVSSTDPDGRVTTRALNAEDDATQITYSQAGQATITVDQTFNSAGQKTSVSNATGTDAFTYDSSGRLVGETGPGAGFTYTYAPGGFAETYPQADGATGGTAVNYTLDDAGNVMTVSAPSAGVNVSYLRNNARQVTGEVLGNGLVETDSYNQQGELVSQDMSCATTGGTTQNMGSAQYAYDAQGEPTNEYSTVGGASTMSAYGYDATGEVDAQSSSTVANTTPVGGCTTGTSYPPGSPNSGADASGTASSAPPPGANVASPAARPGLASTPSTANPLRYDHVGNRTTANGVTYVYNGADELTSASNGSNATYDNAGDLTSTTVNGQKTIYAYNAADQLVSVTLPNGTVVGYTYDPNGNLLTRSLNASVVDNYSWDPSGTSALLAMEVNGAGKLIAQYFYGAGPVAIQTPTGTYYDLTDARGDVTQLSDMSGAIVANYVYDAFGNVLPSSTSTPGAPNNPLLFEGQYLDPSTGLYDLRARHYDPSSGRFTQPDPVGPSIGTPVVSPYVFAGNQPTASGDPTGDEAVGSVVESEFVPTGHSTESANEVAGVKMDATVANIGAKVLLKVGAKLANLSATDSEVLSGGARDAGRLLGVVGIGLGAYITYEDCSNDGPGSLQCIGDITGLVISSACLAITDGVGSAACGAAAFLGPLIIEHGPQIAAFVTSAYEYLSTGLESCGTGPSASCVGATVAVAVGVACAVLSGGAAAVACVAAAGALDYLLTSYGPAMAAGLVYAGDQVASGFDKAGSAISSGYDSAVATLEGAGYDAVQLGVVLAGVFELGAAGAMDELNALGYDAEGVADVLEGVYDQAAAEVATLMNGAGYAVGQVADGLKTAFGYLDTQTAAVLASIGETADQVAQALESAYTETLQSLATALSAVDYGAGVIASELATLGATLGDDAQTVFNDTVQILTSDIGYSLGEVFGAVESEGVALYGGLVSLGTALAARIVSLEGASVAVAEQLAQALSTAYGETVAEVATALNEALSGISGAIDLVTQALEYGLDQTDAEVAVVLAGLGYDVSQVAQELLTWFGDSADQAVAALNAAFSGLSDEASQIAGALSSVYEQTTSEIENALGTVFSQSTIQAIGGAFSSFGSDLSSAAGTVGHYLNPANWF
jgi:RHS repeat-associated protein